MGSFEVHGLDEFISQLNQIEFDKIAPKMLEKAKPVVEKNIKNRAAAHVRTGSMLSSIKGTSATKTKDGYKLTIRPTGKDSKGVRNMEKMAYLEYGTYKQAATPVMLPAVRESENSVMDKMQEVLEKELGT